MFWKVESRGNGFWSIANRQTGKYLEVRAPNPSITRQSEFRAGDPAQEWWFAESGEIEKPKTGGPKKNLKGKQPKGHATPDTDELYLK